MAGTFVYDSVNDEFDVGADINFATGKGIISDTVDINGGAIDDTVIGGASPAAGTFTTLTATVSLELGANNNPTQGLKMKDTGGVYRTLAHIDADDALVLRPGKSGGAVKINNYTNSTEMFQFSDGGIFFIGDNANTDMTVGLTINQGANDNQILAFKSSDVAHGMTAIAETDTFARFYKTSAVSGGLNFDGLTEDVIGISMNSRATNDDTSKNSSATAGVTIVAGKKSGSTVGALGANANILVVSRSAVGAAFIVDAEGDFHYDGTDAGAYDEYDDIALVRAFDLVTSPESVIRTKFDDFVKYNRRDLERLGIIGRTTEAQRRRGIRPLVCGSQLQKLHNGALVQIYTKMMEAFEKLEALTGLKLIMA